MRIAVAYNPEDNSVWQHFGRTEYFKIYEVENNKVVSSEVVDSNGQSHGGLVNVIAELGAVVFICGGCGSHIAEMLEECHIKLVPGVTGDADKAVDAYLAGNLETNEEAVHEGCHHHEEEEEEEEGGCGCTGSCGGCGGGCHTMLEGPNAGKTVRVHYTGTFNDGEKFDSSYDRGEPLEFISGAGQMIKGFDIAVLDMKVGEKKSIHLSPEEAYGPKDPDAVLNFHIGDLPGCEGLNVGDKAYLTNQFGQPVPVTVVDKTEEIIVLDANHEMAGKELNFDIELVEII